MAKFIKNVRYKIKPEEVPIITAKLKELGFKLGHVNYVEDIYNYICSKFISNSDVYGYNSRQCSSGRVELNSLKEWFEEATGLLWQEDVVDKWAISENAVRYELDFQNWYRDSLKGYRNPEKIDFSGHQSGFFHYPAYKGKESIYSSYVETGYKLITYKQWKERYAKETNPTIYTEDNIIGLTVKGKNEYHSGYVVQNKDKFNCFVIYKDVEHTYPKKVIADQLNLGNWIEIKESLINNKTKTNNYGSEKCSNTTGKAIEVCRPIATIERGQRAAGNTIHGRRSIASIAIGHLSNQQVSGW